MRRLRQDLAVARRAPASPSRRAEAGSPPVNRRKRRRTLFARARFLLPDRAPDPEKALCFRPSLCAARCCRWPGLGARKGQEKGDVGDGPESCAGPASLSRARATHAAQPSPRPHHDKAAPDLNRNNVVPLLGGYTPSVVSSSGGCSGGRGDDGVVPPDARRKCFLPFSVLIQREAI